METQQYDLSDPNEPVASFSELSDKEEKVMGDSFDLYALASEVHSPVSELTRDFTLGQLNGEFLSGKFPKFIREQLKVIRIVQDFLNIPKYKLMERYNNEEFVDNLRLCIEHNVNKIRDLMLMEIYSMVVLSRSDGQILKAILTHGRTSEEVDSLDDPRRRTVQQKLMENSK